MEFPCESFTYAKKRRPRSSKLVELHVLYVPDDQWDRKLHKVPADATDSFISAGFIRVYPDITLKTLRSELGVLLGTDRRIGRFSFLKCVGRSLALVKSKQESDLKVKSFAPPYALQPELYLLPVAESDSSVCSQSLTSDAPSCSDQTYYLSQTGSLTTGTKAPVKFPLIPQCSQQTPPTPSSDEEEEEEEKGEVEEESYSSTDEENEPLSSPKRDWAHGEPRSSQHHSPPLPTDPTKMDAAQVKVSPAKGETAGETAGRKEKQSYRRSRAVRDSGIPESLEDRDSGFSITQDRFRKSKDTQTLKFIRNKPNNMVPEHAVGTSTRLARYCSTPQARNSALASHKAAAAPAFQTNRDELMEEIKLVREERKQLEWTRQELLRKGKDLLAQNRHRRNQARDRWKKKYFETKKATAPLEETLKNLRQELETFYNKLLYQLQARDNRSKPRRQSRCSTKNEIIIQIMTESYEIDNLKRKVEDGRMKLVTEIKLRKQAATELRALRAELAQKKSQSSHSGPAPRGRAQAQSTNA